MAALPLPSSTVVWLDAVRGRLPLSLLAPLSSRLSVVWMLRLGNSGSAHVASWVLRVGEVAIALAAALGPDVEFFVGEQVPLFACGGDAIEPGHPMRYGVSQYFVVFAGGLLNVVATE